MLDLWLRMIWLFGLRLGPQDLPARAGALVAAIVAYAGTALANAALARDASGGESAGDGAGPLAAIGGSVVLSSILVRALLGLRGVPARWLQTMTALFGCAAVYHLLNLPLVLMMTDPPDAFTSIVAVLLFFWSFAVDGHIYRHALQTSMSVGLLVAVGMFAVSYFILSAMLGVF